MKFLQYSFLKALARLLDLQCMCEITYTGREWNAQSEWWEHNNVFWLTETLHSSFLQWLKRDSTQSTSMTFDASKRREASSEIESAQVQTLLDRPNVVTACCRQIIIISAMTFSNEKVALKKEHLCKHHLSLFSPHYCSTCRRRRSKTSLIAVVKQRFVFLCVSLVSKITSRTVYFGRLSGSRLIITICSTLNSLHPPHPHSS